MAGNKNSGFASNSPIQQRFTSAKGGRVKTKKGLGAMDPDRARVIQLAGVAKRKLIREERSLTNGKDSISSRNAGSSA